MTDDRRFWTVKQIRLADGRRGDVIRWDSKGDWFALDTDVVQARPDWQLVDVQGECVTRQSTAGSRRDRRVR